MAYGARGGPERPAPQSRDHMGVLRSAFLWSSRNAWLAGRLPRYGFARRAVRRFMPGETLDDALLAAAELRKLGVGTVLTLLGEEVLDGAQALAVAQHYLAADERIAGCGLDAELSLKPTHLGIGLAPGSVRAHVAELARAAQHRGRKLWIDMEGSELTDATLRLARRARLDSAGVGVCLQANLRRTEADLEALLPLGISIRLVKGAYLEPREIAYADKAEVDANYMRLGLRLLEHAATVPPVLAGTEGMEARYAFATHDEAIIDALCDAGVGAIPRCEIQLLYGIRPALQRRLARSGVPLRILISYGDAWFAWYMRRLAERPANVWFLVRSIFSR